jgi:myo-inositol-1(or 4)-monophosphatase
MSYLPFISKTLQSVKSIAVNNQKKVSPLTIKAGDNNQVLTETDIEIGKTIVDAIQTAYPGHNIIDEEAGVIDNGSDITWVVDPIDGTSNFAMGLPTYGVMVGVLEQDKPVAGGVILPSFDELYLGEQGTQATKNREPISVSTQASLLNCLVAYGIDGHQEAPQKTKAEAVLLGEIILSIRNLRTTNSAYDMAKTTEGMYGLFLNQTTKIWDNVAIQPIIEAAGGICTDFYGQPIDYSNHLKRSEENFTICAGSVQLHQQVQEIIAKHTQG